MLGESHGGVKCKRRGAGSKYFCSAGLIGSSYKACSFDQFSTTLAGISLI